VSEPNSQTRISREALSGRFLGTARAFSGLLVVAVVMLLWAGKADAQEDEYLRIYTVIQEADSLSTNQPAAALSKYQQAQAALQQLQRNYRDWNPKVVAYRLNYVTEKITALSAKASRPGGGTATNTSASTPQVKLLEAGAEPRKALRLHPKPGDKQSLEMTVKTEMKMGETQDAPMKMPTMTIAFEVTAKAVADGNVTYVILVSDISVPEEPGVMAQAAEAMKSALANLKGQSGTGTVSDRGFTKGPEIKAQEKVDPQSRQIMDQMKEFFSQFVVEFPEEAIGQGAKWEVKMPLTSQGMTVNETATYELASLDPEGLQGSVKSSVVQSAANQKIENPAMPGLKMNLVKMAGTSTGSISFDLGKVMPLESTLESHSDMTMEMETGGQKQTVTMKMGMNLQLGTK
jgi:hypothetical protein